MDHREPLSMPEAKAIWLKRLPELKAATVNHLRRAPLTRPKPKAKGPIGAEAPRTAQTKRAARPTRETNLSLARAALVVNECLHEEILQELGIRFFRRVQAGKVWAGTKVEKDKRTKEEKEVAHVDCWLSSVHKRVARELGRIEARQYLYRIASSPNAGADGESSNAPELGVVGEEVSPEQVASMREEISILEPVLKCLPEHERQVFLRRVYGDSYEEIARALETTAAAAKTSVHRTRQKLLEEYEGKDKNNDHRSKKAKAR